MKQESAEAKKYTIMIRYIDIAPDGTKYRTKYRVWRRYKTIVGMLNAINDFGDRLTWEEDGWKHGVKIKPAVLED